MNMAFQAPQRNIIPEGYKSIFLGGSIEMDKAEKWQDSLTAKLNENFKNLVIFNPRRDDWDSSWTQEITDRNFHEQVDWEHHHILKSDFLLLYFQPGTKSPISLLELGLAAGHGKQTVVCCPDGFWRRGNVEFIALTYGFDLITSIDELPNWLRENGAE